VLRDRITNTVRLKPPPVLEESTHPGYCSSKSPGVQEFKGLESPRMVQAKPRGAEEEKDDNLDKKRSPGKTGCSKNLS
jgi:hypothetical protein